MSAEKKVCEILIHGREYVASNIINELNARNGGGYALNEDEMNRVAMLVQGAVGQCMNTLADQVIRLNLDTPKVTKSSAPSAVAKTPKKGTKKK